MLKPMTLALAALLSVSRLPAQTAQPDPLLDHLIGHWVLCGPMAWHMDNDSAGVRRPFARVTLVRE